MKHLSRALLVVLFLWVASRSAAQLNETLAQTEGRYGKSIDQWADEEVPGATSCRYQMNGLEIDVSFIGDRVASMGFSRMNNAEFTDAEIRALLDANTGPSSWGAPEIESKPSADGKPEVSWDRADAGAFASYWYDDETKRRVFDLQTAAYAQAEEAAEAAKRPKRGKR